MIIWLTTKGLGKKGRDGSAAERVSAAGTNGEGAYACLFRDGDGVQTDPKVEAGGGRKDMYVCKWM